MARSEDAVMVGLQPVAVELGSSIGLPVARVRVTVPWQWDHGELAFPDVELDEPLQNIFGDGDPAKRGSPLARLDCGMAVDVEQLLIGESCIRETDRLPDIFASGLRVVDIRGLGQAPKEGRRADDSVGCCGIHGIA